MSEVTTPVSGATGATVGDGAETKSADSAQKTQETNQAQDTPKTVSWGNHQRVLDDMHRYKSQARELEEKLGNLNSDRLREKEDWKGLAEAAEEKAKSAIAERDRLMDSFVATAKYNEVRTRAIQSGLRKEAERDLEFLDLKDIQVETTTTGRNIIHGAKEFIENLKILRPHWFSSSQTPDVNGGGGGTPPKQETSLTASDVTRAERDWRTGKISKADYHKVHQNYVSQRQSQQRG